MWTQVKSCQSVFVRQTKFEFLGKTHCLSSWRPCFQLSWWWLLMFGGLAASVSSPSSETHTHTHAPGFHTSSKMILFSPHGSKPGPSQICQRSRRYPLEIHSWCRWNLDLLMKQLFTLRAGVDHINSTPYLDLWHLTVTLVRSTWVITGDFNLSLVQVGSIFQFVVLGPGKQKHTHTLISDSFVSCQVSQSSDQNSPLLFERILQHLDSSH